MTFLIEEGITDNFFYSIMQQKQEERLQAMFIQNEKHFEKKNKTRLIQSYLLHLVLFKRICKE